MTDPTHRLYYHQPASHWEEALPIGSGRLGAMVWGNPRFDAVPLNEDTFWSGYPKDTGRDGGGLARKAPGQLRAFGRLRRGHRRRPHRFRQGRYRQVQVGQDRHGQIQISQGRFR